MKPMAFYTCPLTLRSILKFQAIFMSDILIDYDYILSEAHATDYEEAVQFLWNVLPEEWCEKYRDMTSTTTNILQFNDYGFEYLFDFSSELVTKDGVSIDRIVEDRVVAVYGRSQSVNRKRDASRMRGFLGGPIKDSRKSSTDKGHFIGHSLGGGLDVNLFPQRTDVNRGWSTHGKVFRAMERYCSKNPGTFVFCRPIYSDHTWRPCSIEYGLLLKTVAFWIERFEN